MLLAKDDKLFEKRQLQLTNRDNFKTIVYTFKF